MAHEYEKLNWISTHSQHNGIKNEKAASDQPQRGAQAIRARTQWKWQKTTIKHYNTNLCNRVSYKIENFFGGNRWCDDNGSGGGAGGSKKANNNKRKAKHEIIIIAIKIFSFSSDIKIKEEKNQHKIIVEIENAVEIKRASERIMQQ